MRPLLGLFINLPWAIVGFLGAIVSIPVKVEIEYKHLALIIWVRKLPFLPSEFSGWTCGHIILIKTKLRDHDVFSLERTKRHELIHVEQFDRFWGIFPLIYGVEHLRRGYRKNRFEIEAYTRSSNR